MTMLPSQADVDREIAQAGAVPGEPQPRLGFPAYRGSVRRHPTRPPHLVAAESFDPESVELWAPCFGRRDVAATDADLTSQHVGAPIGERIVVTGTVVDGDGHPVAHQLVEVWQANAAGRYRHAGDRHPAPLDPNFTGLGRCLTDADGTYRFQTIKPGPYPWRNHRNAWRPSHIHFSLFGTEFTQRLVTQMYFPGDQMLAFDPIYQSITDQRARERLVAGYDHELSTPEWSTGYRWDIVLTGTQRTPLDAGGRA